MDRALRVVHLEDNPRDAEVVRDLLEAGGIACDITRVQTREDFVVSLDKGGLDLILADLSLPSFDGMAALKIAAQRSPDVPFIFVSGTLGEELAIEAIKRGATDCVLKERLSGIVRTVNRALREAGERIERKRSEEAARAANDRFEGILNIAQDAIISIDSDQRITLFNQGAEKVFGYTQAEVIGRPLDLLLPQRFEGVHRQHIEEFARSPDAARVMGQRSEVSGRRKDGSEFPAEASISKLDLGGELVFTVILRDITERKRTEEALRQSEEQWRAAYSSNPTMYFILDAAGTVVSVNDFGAEQLGYGADELLGQPVLNVSHEADRKRVQRNARDCFQKPGRRMRWEARKIRKDGTVLWVRETANAVSLKNQPVLLVVCEDITERKHAEEELRRSAAYLAEAQRLSHTGSWAANVATGDAVHWSEEMFRIHGADPHKGAADREEYFQIVHPADRDRLREASERAWREKAEFVQDYRIVLPVGTTKHLHAIGHPVLDETGEVIEIVGTVMDVTERKHGEEERAEYVWFLESMDRINRAMQGTDDLDKMMGDVLEAVLEMFAGDRAWLVYPCDPEAPSWRPVMEHTKPEFPGAFAMGNELPVDTEVATVFRSARAATGAVLFGPACEHPVPVQVAERFSIRSTMVMAVYPKVDRPYLFGLHQCSRPRQWTAQEKRLFEEIGRRLADALTSLLVFRSLRESEARLDEAQRIAHVGYWEYDIATGGIALSEEASRIHGLKQREFANWQERLRELVYPEDRARVMQAFGTALERGARFEVECRLVCPDGEVRTVQKRAHVTQDESGRPRHVFGMVQDITGLRQAEEALREARAALARVNRVTTLGVLAASIAHEVNQPLGAMVTSAASCSRWLAADPPDFDKAQRALERIARDGKRAGEVIERIRTLVQRQAPRRDAVDVNEAILEVIAITRDEMQRNGIALRTSLAQDLPPVAGDRVQLQQVILNLVVNAIEAMSAVADQRREVAVRSAKDGGAVLVEVRDSGPGVDPERVDQLFEAFYTTKAEGIGMGLSISHSIIEAHGGRLWAGPNEPHGAAFQFSLPAALTTSIACIGGDTDNEPQR